MSLTGFNTTLIPNLDPTVWVQWWSGICCQPSSKKYLPKSNIKLESHLRNKEKQTAEVVYGRCVSWVWTAPWMASQGIKDSLELHTACVTLKTHKPKSCLCLNHIPAVNHTCADRRCWVYISMWVRMQTFSGGCDALESHWSSLSHCHPHMKDSSRKQISIPAPPK